MPTLMSAPTAVPTTGTKKVPYAQKYNVQWAEDMKWFELNEK